MATASSSSTGDASRIGALPLIELLVKNGHADSEDGAAALIRRGRVIVGGSRVYDETASADADAAISVTGQGKRYVSRGGTKLEHALRSFQIDVSGKICIDVGSSAGGFTDCLLAYGAARVYSVDVGYGLLDWELRNHPKVVVLERTNARILTSNIVPEKVDVAVIDVNHISISKILPAISPLSNAGGEVVALFKPQFEIPREWTARSDFESGVVKSAELLTMILKSKLGELADMGFYASSIIESPIKGAKGNKEFFVRFDATGEGGGENACDNMIRGLFECE